jgi:hypothetical protein
MSEGIAWFPLGPRDVYRPSYPVSQRYFNDVNTSNTTINTTNITNVYNNVNVRNITYVNQQVPVRSLPFQPLRSCNRSRSGGPQSA